MSALAASSVSAKKQSRVRDYKMEIMEKSLLVWIRENERQTDEQIRKKALEIFTYLKNVSTEEKPSFEFIASKGWLTRFKNRFSLQRSNIEEVILKYEPVD